jgi:hypothetical protein
MLDVVCLALTVLEVELWAKVGDGIGERRRIVGVLDASTSPAKE